MRSYMVYNPENQWLGDSEHHWTSVISEAAIFTDPHLARDIGIRELPDKEIFVLRIMP